MTKCFEEAKTKETDLENKLQVLQEKSSKIEPQSSLGQQPVAFFMNHAINEWFNSSEHDIQL